MLLRDDLVAFDALRDEVVVRRQRTGQGIVEKDYWATEVLRGATLPVEGCAVQIFKGGTSLSKAFGIIERFSEDIDLLVATELTGNSLKRALRAVAQNSCDQLGIAFEREREGRGYLNARFTYPARAQTDLLSDGVLLEMGCRGGPLPNEVRTVRSLMSEVADEIEFGSSRDYEDLSPFELTVLAPERTLAEKLAFLHHRATTRDLERLHGGARHLYDVYRLLGHASTVKALQVGVMAELMEDIDERSARANWGYTPRPKDGFAASPAFADDPDIRRSLSEGYVEIGGLIWGAQPDVSLMVDFIRERAELL